MSVDNNLNLIMQICNSSGMSGEELQALKERLQQQSREELEAELLNTLINRENNGDKGLTLEHTSSVLLANHDKKDYQDEKGRKIREYSDGNNLIERIITTTDAEGNNIEEIITYSMNRPLSKTIKKNGKEESISKFSYIKSKTKDNKEIYIANIETEKADGTKERVRVLATDKEGNYPALFVLFQITTDKDGNTTELYPMNDKVIEVKRQPNGQRITSVYNANSIYNYSSKPLTYQRLQNSKEEIELSYDGKGNTYTTVNAGDGWEKLAKRFHTTPEKLKKLNPKIKNLKAGQDILVPGEFRVDSKEIGKVQSRQEAAIIAHNAEIDRRIGQEVAKGTDTKHLAELKAHGFKPTVENYYFYKRFNELDNNSKNNVVNAIKYYYKSEHITDPTKIKEKIMEHLGINLFDSGKTIKMSDNLATPYALRKKDVSLETFLTKTCKLDIKKEPAKTIYERLASVPQNELNKIVGNSFPDMSNLNSYHDIASRFESAGIELRTQAEKQMDLSAKSRRERTLGDGQITRGQTVDFALKQVQAARKSLEKHLSDLKDNPFKNLGEIIIEDYRFWGIELNPINNPASKVFSNLARKLGFKKGTIEGLTKSIYAKINELKEKETELIKLKSGTSSRDFSSRYAAITGGTYKPFSVERLQDLCSNPPKQGTKEYKVYEQKVETTIEELLGENFSKEVSNYISTSAGLGSAVEMAMLCYATAGMGSTITIGSKVITGATAAGRIAIGVAHLGGYTAIRTSLNFIDEIDNIIDGSKTFSGVMIGENNAEKIRNGATIIKDWALGKITRDEADKRLEKIGKLTFDDFVSSTGGQFVVNTLISSAFGGAAGLASPVFAKAGQFGTRLGQKLGISAPELSQVTSKIISSSPNGINGAEFMARVYAQMNATNIVGKGIQFAVETAVFYCTNLPLGLIQEKLSESNNEMEKAYKEGRLTEYLLNRFKDEAINLATIQSIGMIVAMMTGANPAVKGLSEKFKEYDTLNNTTIRYENINGQNTVTVEGTTGKLFVEGDLVNLYNKSGELVHSEPLGDATAFRALDAGTKTFYLMNRFMEFENYARTQFVPVPQAQDADAQEVKENQQLQQLQQSPKDNKAKEVPLTPGQKAPYEQPKVEIIYMGPQQMVASSSPVREQTKLPEPLTDKQKIELHEKLQDIVAAYSANNYADVDILNNLTENERKIFTEEILHLGCGEPTGDDYDFLLFVNGEKPAALIGGTKYADERTLLDKLKSDKVDVFHRTLTLGDGTQRNNTILINKQMAKSIISENKELFQTRLGMSKNATVDEIYEKMISDESILKDSDESSDLTGLILGYPKYNTMIFRLDAWIDAHNIMSFYDMRVNVDIEKYKAALRQALQAEDSPYKGMSKKFKKELLNKINEITEVVPSRKLLNNDAKGYTFNYATPEPEELIRIEQARVRTANNLAPKTEKDTPDKPTDVKINEFRAMFENPTEADEFLQGFDIQKYKGHAKMFANPKVLKDLYEIFKPHCLNSDGTIDQTKLRHSLQLLFLNFDGKFTQAQTDGMKALMESYSEHTLNFWVNQSILQNIDETNLSVLQAILNKHNGQDLVVDGQVLVKASDNKMNIFGLDAILYQCKGNEEKSQKALQMINSNASVDNRGRVNYLNIESALQNKGQIPSDIQTAIRNGAAKYEYPEAQALMEELGINSNSGVSAEALNTVIKGGNIWRHEMEPLTTEQMPLLKSLLTIIDSSGSRQLVDKNVLRSYEFNWALRNAQIKDFDYIVEFVKQNPQSIYNLNDLVELLNKQTTDLKDFLVSPDFEAEIRANSAGKYQKEVINFLQNNSRKHEYKFQLIKSGLTKADFLQSLRKFSKSTFKLAYETPNQYLSGVDRKYSTPVDGKYPNLNTDETRDELKNEQNQMAEFFVDNMGNLFRALKYLDTDTIAHMMDKRTNNFEEALKDLNELTDENFEILSNLLKCNSSKTGKPLSPRDKIQLCQIVQMFQMAGFDMNVLKNAVSEGKVSIQDLKKLIQNKVFEKAGIDPNDKSIDDNKKKFNEEYFYLAMLDKTEYVLTEGMAQLRTSLEQAIPELRNNETTRNLAISSAEDMLKNISQMQTTTPEQLERAKEIIEMYKHLEDYTDEEVIETIIAHVKLGIKESKPNNSELDVVIRASILGDFNEYITDTSNKYGQSNLKTQETFTQKGLNFNLWDNPQVPDRVFEVNGQKLTVKFWDRNPQEDLFMGNKTSCCTQIGTGINAAATPIYLESKSFQVIQIFDNNGNVIGMSRVFMADVNGKPSMIMDTVEFNKIFIKGMSTEDEIKMRDELFHWVNQYAQQVTGDTDTQVYFRNEGAHSVFMGEGLQTEEHDVDFIGDVPADKIYINAADFQWLPTENLKNYRTITSSKEDPHSIEWTLVPKDEPYPAPNKPLEEATIQSKNESEIITNTNQNIAEAYSGREYPHYDYDNACFTKASGAKTLEKVTPSENDTMIHISTEDKIDGQYPGTIAGTTTLDQTLYTDKMAQCATLVVVDRAHNTQSLIHCFPGNSIESSRKVIESIFAGKNPNELEISLVAGYSETAPQTVQFLLDTVNDLTKGAKVQLYNFADYKDLKIFHRGLILQDGKLKCCDDREVKNKVTNPEENITYCKFENKQERTGAIELVDGRLNTQPVNTKYTEDQILDRFVELAKSIEDESDIPDLTADLETFKKEAYEIYKQDSEIFDMILECKDFNGNPITPTVSFYLLYMTFQQKSITSPAQLRNLVTMLSLYEHRDMEYSPKLGISETDFNLLKEIEESRHNTQGDWLFDSGAPSGFDDIYEGLLLVNNDAQKQILTTLFKENAIEYYDIKELTRGFSAIKTETDAAKFMSLHREFAPKMDKTNAVVKFVDKITTPEMKALADKLMEVYVAYLPSSNSRLITIMEAAHLGAYDRIMELLEKPTKANKDEVTKFGCAVDKHSDTVRLLGESGILSDRRFSAKMIDLDFSGGTIERTVERNLLAPEKNYTAEDVKVLANIKDNEVYNKILELDLMKDFTASDAYQIVNCLDYIGPTGLLNYRHVLTAQTMLDLASNENLREKFINNPDIQKLGPLGIKGLISFTNAKERGVVFEKDSPYGFWEQVCDDVQLGKLDKYECGRLFEKTHEVNLKLVRNLYENMDKYNIDINTLIDIASVTSDKTRRDIAQRMVEDPNFPNDLIASVLEHEREENRDLLEQLCFDPEFPKEFLEHVLECAYSKDTVKAISGLVSTPEMKNWFVANLRNDLHMDLIINLARTQRKLYQEAQKTKSPKQPAELNEARGTEVEEAKPQDVQQAIDKMVTLGMDKNMADKAYVKLCMDKQGNVDKVKLDAVLALIEAFGINKYTNDKGKLRTSPNISPKEIQEIFAFSIGSALSSANGQFRPDIVKDIIKLRQAGIEDVKLATTISCIKNMGLVEMKDRFNTKVRNDAVKRIDELADDIKASLTEAGFDLTAITEKASQEAKGGKVKRTNLETTILRSLDSIHGDEKVLITKHKNDKGFDQKLWGDPEKFKEWAENKVKDIIDFEKNPEYTTTFGDAQRINAERKLRIKDWYEYLTTQSDYKDNPFVHLLILEEITKDLKSNNAATPKPVSAELFNEVHDALLDENNKLSFDTIYSQKMREKAISQYSHGIHTVDGIEGQWVTIPRSQKNDPDYDEHVAMVQSLAEGSSWCLRYDNANNYIQDGNLHFFVDKYGKSQVAMHEKDGTITQIQKRYKQDSSVPVPYVDVIEEFNKTNNLNGLENKIKAAKDAKPAFEKLKKTLTKLMEDKDYLAVFKELGFKVTIQNDGTYVLSEYRPIITSQYSLSDLGIDEDELMSNVSGIMSSINLDGSGLTEMKKLRTVNGTIAFGDNQISDLRSLETVDGQKIIWIKPANPQNTPRTRFAKFDTN